MIYQVHIKSAYQYMYYKDHSWKKDSLQESERWTWLFKTVYDDEKGDRKLLSTNTSDRALTDGNSPKLKWGPANPENRTGIYDRSKLYSVDVPYDNSKYWGCLLFSLAFIHSLAYFMSVNYYKKHAQKKHGHKNGHI